MKIRAFLWLLAFTLVPAPMTAQAVHAEGGPVRYVGGSATHGDDLGAQINQAYASLPASGGTIVVIAEPNGTCYDFAVPIVAAVPGKYLLLESGSLPSQIATESSACLNYVPTTASSAVTLDFGPLGTTTTTFQAHGIRNMTLINNRCETTGGCASEAIGITFGGTNGMQDAIFAGLQVIGFGTALSLADSNTQGGNLSFRDCALSYNTTGFADSDGDPEQITFDTCSFQGNGTGVSSSASVRLSNSWLESNTILGVNCSAPAVCDLNDDHFENAEADTTHFLAGNGVFSVVGGDMRDDRTAGNTDWWMAFGGTDFFILGTVITSAGRTATCVVLDQSQGTASFQNNSPAVLATLFSNASLISSINPRSMVAETAASPAVSTGSLAGVPICGDCQPVVDARAPQSAGPYYVSDGVQYVSNAGNDSNRGRDPGHAKAREGSSISACGSGSCKVIVSGAYAAPHPSTYPQNVVMTYNTANCTVTPCQSLTTTGFGGINELFSTGGTRFPTYANPDTQEPFKIWVHHYTNRIARHWVNNAFAIDYGIIADENHDAPHSICTICGTYTANWIGTLSGIRHDSASSESLGGLSLIVSDDSGNGLRGKGGLLDFEGDMNNGSGADPTSWDDTGGTGGAGDWYNTGELLTSVGVNKGGIGLFVHSNNPGNGNWQRGEVIRDWSAAGLHIINSNAGATGQNAIVLEDLQGSFPSSCNANGISWTVGGNPSIGNHYSYLLGSDTTCDFVLWDAKQVVSRFQASYGPNGNTYVRATGTGLVEVQTNSSTVPVGLVGTCSMSGGTSCTATVPSGYAHCIATVQGTTPNASACSISSTTLTVTAATSNSATWAWQIIN